ncbi:hypothetical protein, partial [Cysteiniphilum sp. SYW-8]|uniref:hypothetical protein n=1 Tax=Cysteiniphilum sp. SYW-8 TaxID=2610890 RepID=UPI001CD10B32
LKSRTFCISTPRLASSAPLLQRGELKSPSPNSPLCKRGGSRRLTGCFDNNKMHNSNLLVFIALQDAFKYASYDIFAEEKSVLLIVY